MFRYQLYVDSNLNSKLKYKYKNNQLVSTLSLNEIILILVEYYSSPKNHVYF